MIPPIPSPPLATSRDPDTARLRTSSATRAEAAIGEGNFFVGSSIRTEIPVSDDYISVIKAGVDKYLIIEDAIIDPIFNVSDSGRFSISLAGYVDISNGNDWSYTPVSPAPVGRPLNASVVNNLAQGTIDLGVTAGPVSGVADYPLFFADYFLETQGARESVSITGTSFFDKGRQIVIAPGQELMIRTQTDGTSGATATLKTIFFVSEVSIEDAPSLLGKLA